jgi:pimeloyl-ACP methyl ester carboxylesterase
MELAPRLIDVSVPPDPAGAVLVLHGGASRRDSIAVSPTQLSVLRMVPIAKRLARAGRGRLAVFRLLNAHRGWATHHTPVHDAHWALDEIAARLGQVPVSLVGHSLGGRAALLAAGRDEVRSAVALAPWVYPSDVPRGLEGQRLLIVHGTADRVARIDRAEALARRLAAVADVTFVRVEGGRHAMLSRRAAFERPAAEFAVGTLLGDTVVA